MCCGGRDKGRFIRAFPAPVNLDAQLVDTLGYLSLPLPLSRTGDRGRLEGREVREEEGEVIEVDWEGGRFHLDNDGCSEQSVGRNGKTHRPCHFTHNCLATSWNLVNSAFCSYRLDRGRL